MSAESKPRVLVSNLLMVAEAARFRPALEAHGLEPTFRADRQFLREGELLDLLPGFDGMIAGDDELNEKVLSRVAGRLRVISKWGVGLDSIDLAAAERLGIAVYNSPGAFGEAVAEAAMGYLLLLTRQLHRIDREVRRGGWPKPSGRGLRGKVLGLVGLGAIGRETARRARGFGLEILASDVRAELPPEEGVRLVAFDEVLERSDHLCLACNLTVENHHLIDARALARMKPGACLINVARGPLVDETALVEALERGHLAGAALDVYEHEPLSADHPLTRLDSVILGSHNANNLVEANEQVHRTTIDNLLRGLGLLS